MNDRALLVLLLLLAADRARSNDRSRLMSNLAARATGAFVDVVNPDVVLEHVDLDAVLERVDLDAALDRIDVDRLMDRIDIDSIVDRVDVNRLMQRVDIDAILDRVDVDRLMQRVDVEAIVDRVDVERVVNRAGIPDVVRESTGALAGSALDVIRRQIVALDTIVGRAAYRLVGRDPNVRPSGPAALVGAERAAREGRAQVTGFYAGPIARALAFAADTVFLWISVILMALAVGFAVGIFNISVDADSPWVAAISLGSIAIVAFTYYWAALSMAGKTIGMAIVGLRVLARDGGTLSPRQAAVRTLVYPFSFFVFGLGFVGIFTSAERRALHDAAAGSVVVYDWGDRPAEMPAPISTWVDRRTREDAPEP